MVAPLYCCGEYKVDSDGYVLSKRDGHRLKPSVCKTGYYIVTLMIDGKRKSIPVHLAVARSFLGNKTQDGLQVNHKDGNRTNNCLDNLEWVTQSENIKHSYYVLHRRVGGNNKQMVVRGYDNNTGELVYEYNSLADCARSLCGCKKVSSVKNSIWRAITGIRKSYLGCKWSYYDGVLE